MPDEPTLYVAPPEGIGKVVLEKASMQLTGFLVGTLGSAYEISCDEVHERTAWSQTIAVRQGSRIGADVVITWNGTTMTLGLDAGSTLGTAVAMAFTLPLVVTGGVMGYLHLGPFAGLPGYRLAALIGALIMMIPGAALAAVVNSFLARGRAPENAALRETIRTALVSLPDVTSTPPR